VLVFSDVSGAYRVQRALRERERELALVVAQMPGLVSRVDLEGRYQYASPGYERWFGRPLSEVVGRTQLEVLGEVRHAELAGLIERALAGEVVRYEGHVKTLHGERYVLGTLVPDLDDDGRVRGHFTFVTDISERKRTEEALQSVQRQLLQAQKLEALGTLAGGIAHDFNNMVAGILGHAELALQDLPPGHPAAASLAQIQRTGRRARALVQQILSFSHGGTPPRGVIDLRTVVDETTALLQAQRPAGTRLEVRTAAQALPLVGDATQLHQVLLNLCLNAWQALPQGRGRVCIAAEGDAAEVWLQVEDDGIGIDEATRARIFDPFFTTKPAGQGSGLGLAVVHGIVQTHQGRIVVRSEPGAGACFTLHFPRAASGGAMPASEAAGPPPPARLRPGRGQHVLYVDDDEVMREVASRLLQQAGWRVSCCEDAARALALLDDPAQDVALLISDLDMPGASGLALCSAVRRRWPQLPLLLSTGFVTEQPEPRAAGRRHAAGRAGADPGRRGLGQDARADHAHRLAAATGQVSPGGVLAVTFTNKAAKEMLTRLSAMLPVAVRGMWIGTFHGLCNRFLRAHWKLAGLPQGFQILDSGDQLSAVKRVIKAMNLDEERFVPKQVSWFIAGAKEDGRAPARRRRARRAHAQAGRGLPGLRGAVPARRRGRLRRADAAHLRAAARQRPAARALPAPLPPRAGRRVPGHQPAAVRLAEDVARRRAGGQPAQGVFAVGDDDQSIYAFRGARVGNMADFEREYRVQRDQAGAELPQLRQHPRRRQRADRHNAQRLGKNLRTDAGAGEPVRVYEATSDYAEAQWLLEEAQQLHRSGLPRSEIALLYRSNAQSRVMESALFNAGVPYRVYGGLRFFERAEVKHALAYLRLLENPNDDTSFLRVVNFPARGIGARTSSSCRTPPAPAAAAWRRAWGAVAGKAGANLPASCADRRHARGHAGPDAARDHRARAARQGLLDFYKHRQGRPGPHREPGGTGQRRRELRHAGGLRQGRRGAAGRRAPPPGRAPPPAPDAETGEIMSPLAAFLTHAVAGGRRQPGAGRAGRHPADDGALGQGPGVRRRVHHRHRGRPVPARASLSDADGLEEERRLMYVAITRARQRLYLSFSQTRMLHGQTRYNVKSRFFDELPEAR
jgi:DNA helicase II / ATP-dependent DNA helicase PcrA